MNFLKFLILIIATILILIVGFGLRSDGYFKEEYTVTFNFRKDFLWEIITNQENYSEIKRNIKNIEYLEETRSGNITKWQENYQWALWKYDKTLQVTASSRLNYYDTEILENDLGYTGEISYNFENIDGEAGTKMLIKTNLYVSNLFLRGLYVLKGPNTFSESEVKWIRVGIGKKLLETI